MEADKKASLNPVNTTHIYYKGGFKNNNCSEQVSNQEGKTGDDDKTANMTFNVKTVTPKELSRYVSTIDLLYLSATKSLFFFQGFRRRFW